MNSGVSDESLPLRMVVFAGAPRKRKTPRSPVAYVSFQRLLKPYPSNFRTFVNAVMNRSISSCVL